MLTQKQREAAIEVARGDSFFKIAKKLKVNPCTLHRWNTPEFQEEVERLLNLWAQGIETKGVADVRRQLWRLNDRWRRGQAFVAKRAEKFRELAADNPLLQSVPGGATGMVAWKIKTIHTGEQCYEKVVEYEWDSGLEDNLRAIEQQALTLTGKWKPKHEISFAADGGALRVKNLSALTDDELRTLITLARKLEVEGPPLGIEPPQPEPHGDTLPEHGAAPPGLVPQAG